MSKKRKDTAQSSTLLDFFGKSSIQVRNSKKPRVTAARRPARVAKDEPVDEVIVLDSSEDDDVVEVSPIRPAPKPLQATTNRNARSAPTLPVNAEVREVAVKPDHHSAPVCLQAGGTREGFKAEDVENEREDEPGVSEASAMSIARDILDSQSREPSPFGFPTLLAMPEQSTSNSSVESVPPPQSLPDCSHDEIADTKPSETLQDVNDAGVDEELLGEGDWDMGDDEIELVDVDVPVKPEDEDSVDIDLTVDDAEAPLVHQEELVARCPICEMELVDMKTSEVNNHIDECLNAPPTKESETSSPAASKKLRPLSSFKAPLPPLTDQAGPSHAGIKQSDNDSTVFSTLMSSYKENEAWKEASVAEDRNFRASKANGGRRKAPFYKVMQGMPIAVDAFRYGTIPNVTAYFLTHAHSDHYTNLSAKWDSGPIYCSQATANLIIHMLRVDPKWVQPLPMNVATTIPNTGGVQVTLIEANHCPGSCLFLFEGKQTINAGDSAYKSPFVGSAKVFRYLHCGDFRACPQHVLHPAVQGKRIDHVYLDTTYLDPKYCFPPQPLVISACADLAKRLVHGTPPDTIPSTDAKPPSSMTGWFKRIPKDDKGKEKASSSPQRILVVVGTYSIGKERIVKAIANALDTKVYCDSRKAAILRCQSDPELHALLTSDPKAAGVHLVPLAVIASDRLKTYMERWKGYYTKAIGFRPTGWTYTAPNGTDMLPSIPTIISRSQSRTFTHVNLQPMRNSTTALQVYGVPYSEHSSFFELTCFALSFDWGRMIATVNVGSEASRGKMAKWVERWEMERKKRGKIEVVSYRAADYW